MKSRSTDISLRSRLEAIADKYTGTARRSAHRTIERLFRSGIESFDSLTAVLDDKGAGANVQIASCWALGQLGDKKATTPLLEALKRGPDAVTWEAAKSLGLIGSRRATNKLIQVLKTEPDAGTRTAAAYALGLLCDGRAVQSLIAVLKNDNEKRSLRGHAAEALGNIGDDRAVAPLIAALKNRSVEVRFWSVFALGRIGDPRALPKLKRIVANDKGVLNGWGSIKREASNAVQRILTEAC